MVGSVLRVEVAEGDVVGAKDSLVILESMKMEIPVHPEVGGTVERIAVREGDVVQEGDLLVVLA
jgi:acetyl-CoA carboxylase biotin carboxyl carrier protein